MTLCIFDLKHPFLSRTNVMLQLKFKCKNIGLSFQKYTCQNLWGFKVFDYFWDLASLISKYFIEGAMEPLKCIYIFTQHKIRFRFRINKY